MTEIIDRSPLKGKRRMTRGQMILSTVIFLAGCGIIYMITHNPNAKKDMVVVNVGGIDIVPGKTKAADFLEAGFELAQNQPENIIDETQKIDKDSYVPLIVLSKNQKKYGTITVGNDSGRAASLSEGIILNISVNDMDENAADVTADKTAIKDMTEENLIKAYGEPDTREEDPYIGGTDLEWEKKGYYFTANIGEDGKVQFIRSVYGHY